MDVSRAPERKEQINTDVKLEPAASQQLRGDAIKLICVRSSDGGFSLIPAGLVNLFDSRLRELLKWKS